jgi:hypothetical protein
MKSSTAVSGTITIQFSSAAAQVATVSIAPNKLLYSRVTVTCTELSSGGAVAVYMVIRLLSCQIVNNSSSSCQFTFGQFLFDLCDRNLALLTQFLRSQHLSRRLNLNLYKWW